MMVGILRGRLLLLCVLALAAWIVVGASTASADTASATATVGSPSSGEPDGVIQTVPGIAWNLIVRNQDAATDAGTVTITLELPAYSEYGCGTSTVVTTYDASGTPVTSDEGFLSACPSGFIETGSVPVPATITVPDVPAGGEVVVSTTTWALTSAPASSYTMSVTASSDSVALTAALNGPFIASVSAPASVTAGDQVTYAVDVTGTEVAGDIAARWRASLPAGLVFDSLTPSSVDGGVWSCDSAATADGSVGCVADEDEMSGVDYAFTLTATVPSDYGGGAIGPLTVAASGFSGAATTAVSGSVSVNPASSPPITTPTSTQTTPTTSTPAVTTTMPTATTSVSPPPVPTMADLGVVVNGPKSSSTQAWQDTLTVTNSGPATATTAQVGVLVPAGATVYGSTAPSGWSCSTVPVETVLEVLTCTDTMPFPVSASATIVVTVEATGKSAAADTSSYQLQAAVRSDQADTDSGNDSVSATTAYTGSALTSVQTLAIDTSTITMTACGQDTAGTESVNVGEPSSTNDPGGTGNPSASAARAGRRLARQIQSAPGGFPGAPGGSGATSGAGAASGGAAGAGAAGMSAGAIAGVAAGAAAAAAVAEAVAGSQSSATVLEGVTGCSATMSVVGRRASSLPELQSMVLGGPANRSVSPTASSTPVAGASAPVADASAAGGSHQVKCAPVAGQLRCDLGMIPAHTAVRVTLNVPWGYQFAGQSLTLPTSITSTHGGKTRTIASKRVTVHVARRTIVQVEFKPSPTRVKHGEYADSVEIHDIGTLPVSKDNVCVALPKGAKLLEATGGSRHGDRACWTIKGLVAGRELVKTMTFTPVKAGGKRPTPIFPVPTAKTPTARTKSA